MICKREQMNFSQLSYSVFFSVIFTAPLIVIMLNPGILNRFEQIHYINIYFVRIAFMYFIALSVIYITNKINIFSNKLLIVILFWLVFVSMRIFTLLYLGRSIPWFELYSQPLFFS